MVAIDPVGFGLGALLTLLAVAVHFSRGVEWTPREDITSEVLEQRAATVPETDFPEPMNRAIGGGGAVAGAVGAGEEGAELEDGVEEEPGPGDIPEDEIEYYEVEFVKEGETVELANNEPILDQGEEQGWDLPYACRQGQCVSCSAHIPDGAADEFVVHDNQQMFDQDELDDGYVLTCVAYPRASFSIETSESP